MARKSNNTEFIGEYEIADHKIMTMEEEKRERLIMEALKEFSKGYAYVNMDEIVKRAGISKGLLFHYFGTKKGVFLFLLKYTLNIVNTKFEEIVLEKNDFLQNIWQASKMEQDLSFEQPYVMDFLVKAAFSLKEVFPEGLPKDVPDLTAGILLDRIVKNADRSLLRSDIDAEKAQKIILWTMDGFMNSLLACGGDIENYKSHYDQCMKELEGYLQLLRKLLYQ